VLALRAEIERLAKVQSPGVPPETIHGLRVLLRRFRLLAKIGQPIMGKPVAVQFRKWSGGALDRLGPVRDFDSAIDWLAKTGRQNDLIARLNAVRNRRVSNLRSFLAAIPDGLPPVDGLPKASSRSQDRLRRRHDREIARCADIAIEQSTELGRLRPEDLHRFRRVIRRFRYLLEITASRKQPAGDRMLKRLIRLQDALGIVHSARLLRAVLPDLCGSTGARPLIPRLDGEIADGLKLSGKHLRRLQSQMK